MSKQTEALKLALEALSPWDGEDANHTEQYAACHAIREALAEQETVLPGGGHIPAVPVAVYGYCPECGGAGVMRERRPNGDDKCTNGHKYPSSKALAEQPVHQHIEHCLWARNGNTLCPHVQPAQQQEPVAVDDAGIYEFWARNKEAEQPSCAGFFKRKVYGVWWQVNAAYKNSPGVVPLYTSPQPIKPWVGLTTEDRKQLLHDHHPDIDPVAFFEAVEAKLQEKNA